VNPLDGSEPTFAAYSQGESKLATAFPENVPKADGASTGWRSARVDATNGRKRVGTGVVFGSRRSASFVNNFAYLLDNLRMERRAAVERYCNP
jgi:hypothetical protein